MSEGDYIYMNIYYKHYNIYLTKMKCSTNFLKPQSEFLGFFFFFYLNMKFSPKAVSFESLIFKIYFGE